MDRQPCVDGYGPWNPGLSSQIPREYLPLSTMFRDENVMTGCDRAHELAGFCGLSPFELVEFRPERLIVHELLVRVTADLSVPDGPNYEDLGINFRRMAAKIHETCIRPDIEALTAGHRALRQRAGELLEREVSTHLFNPGPAPKGRGRGKSAWRIFRRTTAATPAQAPVDREVAALAEWRARSAAPRDAFEAACLDALIRIVTAIVAHRGRLVGDPSILVELARSMVCNSHGSEMIGLAIEPHIAEAVRREGYLVLPAQKRPVVMNVKGASAAGKSTTRPQQRELAERLGVPWEHFALISPDIWRKFLLDYASLGEACKYAGALTGHELAIVDRKLDRHMAQKAMQGRMSHMLIDRFRFDSFTVKDGRDVDSTLLTRFGDLIFMFFVITPPDATVERAWIRGQRFGRYKAVDDLLHHNVEAFIGMPQLFFAWASVTTKRMHYEFLDNSVAEGERPRTVAFGWNRAMTILDIKLMLDIDRYRKIDVDARSPGDVYQGDLMAPEQNTVFLEHCAHQIPEVNFADRETGRLYGRMKDGQWVWRDLREAATVMADPDARAGLEAIGWHTSPVISTDAAEGMDLRVEREFTVGAW